jgi:hypothetical protein
MRSVKDPGNMGRERRRELKGQVHWLIVHTGVTRRITSHANEKSLSAPSGRTMGLTRFDGQID